MSEVGLTNLLNCSICFKNCLKITENCSFEFLNFRPIFVILKSTYLVTLFNRKLQFAKLIIFGIFYELLSTQNVNVARFARNVEWDFFCDFQTPYYQLIINFVCYW